MAKSGIFATLNYKLNVQNALLWASSENPKVLQMAKAVPASVYQHWRDTAHKEFTGIKTTPANFAVSCSALLQFFHMTAIENAPMMLPSKAADSVWHTWLDHDPQGLATFLKTQLGRDISHIEKKAMPEVGPGNPHERMADTWRAAHDYHNNPQFAGKLPSIFEADKITGIPTGFWYDRNPEDRREGFFHDMDSKGAPNPEVLGVKMLSWKSVYESMTPARRLKADQEIQTDYEVPKEVSTKQSQVMAMLGIAAGTTAAVYLSSQAEQMEQMELAQKQRDMGGSGVGPSPFGSSSDGGGGDCGGGCGG